MTTSIALASPTLPSVFAVGAESPRTNARLFSSHIRNLNTRCTYMEAVRQFSSFCAEHGILEVETFASSASVE